MIEPSPDFDKWLSRHNGADAIAAKRNIARNSSLTPPMLFVRTNAFRWLDNALYSGTSLRRHPSLDLSERNLYNAVDVLHFAAAETG